MPEDDDFAPDPRWLQCGVGVVVQHPETGRIGVTVDSTPLADPHSVTVAWEPLLSGERSAMRPCDLTVVRSRA